MASKIGSMQAHIQSRSDMIAAEELSQGHQPIIPRASDDILSSLIDTASANAADSLPGDRNDALTKSGKLSTALRKGLAAADYDQSPIATDTLASIQKQRLAVESSVETPQPYSQLVGASGTAASVQDNSSDSNAENQLTYSKKPHKKLTMNDYYSTGTLIGKYGIKVMATFLEENGVDMTQFEPKKMRAEHKTRATEMAKECQHIWNKYRNLSNDRQTSHATEPTTNSSIAKSPIISLASPRKRGRQEINDGSDDDKTDKTDVNEEGNIPLSKKQKLTGFTSKIHTRSAMKGPKRSVPARPYPSQSWTSLSMIAAKPPSPSHIRPIRTAVAYWPGGPPPPMTETQTVKQTHQFLQKIKSGAEHDILNPTDDEDPLSLDSDGDSNMSDSENGHLPTASIHRRSMHRHLEYPAVLSRAEKLVRQIVRQVHYLRNLSPVDPRNLDYTTELEKLDHLRSSLKYELGVAVEWDTEGIGRRWSSLLVKQIFSKT